MASGVVQLYYKAMNYTTEQLDIFAAFSALKPGQTLVVNALAGSGKTSTAVALIKQMSEDDAMDTRFCAFSKAIQSELALRLEGSGAQVCTIHSLGFSALKRGLGANPKVEGSKYLGLIDDYKRRSDLSEEAQAELGKYLDMVRVTLTDFNDPSAAEAMCLEREIDTEVFPELFKAGKDILPRGLKSAAVTIDFTDMLWVPYMHDFKPYQTGTLIVDECQDLSPAQLHLVMKAVRPGGRKMFIGDPNQAIFGFAGADHNSFANIIAATDPVILPLSICWRCPKSVLDTVRDYVPMIQAAPNAEEGEVVVRPFDLLTQDVKAQDMVLCRTTAPLISTAFELIRQGIPVMVKGRDIGAGLISVIKKATRRKSYDFGNLHSILTSYLDREVARLATKRGSEPAIISLTDKVETILVLLERAGGEINSERDLQGYVNRLFGEEARGNQVVFSTAHRAKGLEAHRVFLLCPELMPHPMAKSDAAKIQEHNLRYVAHTRAQKKLTLVDSGDRFKRKKR